MTAFRSQNTWQRTLDFKSHLHQKAQRSGTNPLKRALMLLGVAAFVIFGLLVAAFVIVLGTLTAPFLKRRMQKAQQGGHTFEGRTERTHAAHTDPSLNVIDGEFETKR
ncbi:hypothetical protein [Larsenimonas suaedae]|uniref:Uncharacterized protein n=1 Tax=Larsenimonas suaedae TaxID=1851019 RepID=A0ABU1GT89_9GAMM|nr:hypothetical protein [Larsenimonas suaedae]MCM2972159.1 hypothetical protein [Larsenimonas suaedae]MDR5895045.1 hypothetical protein [Larsenimonas suaedae]